MDHSIAIAALKDELEEARQDATYLAKGIAAMMLKNEAGEKIRPEVILRWRNNLTSQQERVHSLRGTIKFLEHHTLGGK